VGCEGFHLSARLTKMSKMFDHYFEIKQKAVFGTLTDTNASWRSYLLLKIYLPLKNNVLGRFMKKEEEMRRISRPQMLYVDSKQRTELVSLQLIIKTINGSEFFVSYKEGVSISQLSRQLAMSRSW